MTGKKEKSDEGEDFAVSVVHTHNSDEDMNAGEHIDRDLVKFMEKQLIDTNKKD